MSALIKMNLAIIKFQQKSLFVRILKLCHAHIVRTNVDNDLGGKQQYCISNYFTILHVFQSLKETENMQLFISLFSFTNLFCISMFTNKSSEIITCDLAQYIQGYE